MKVTVLGAGAWGTALASHIAKHHDALLWARDAAQIEALAQTHCNQRYLPRLTLNESLRYSADLGKAITHASGPDGLCIAAVPIAGLRALCGLIHDHIQQTPSHFLQNFVFLCKGFEMETNALPHEVIQQVLGTQINCGALFGPSFAEEVLQGLPVALTFASHSKTLGSHLEKACHHSNMRVYSTDDLVGVEVAGAVKNVLAIATGIADGLALGMNSRAALITRGLVEMSRLGVALGGKAETFMGLSGLGDLVLTATGHLSRNRTVGLRLAQGESLEAILASLGHVAEGVYCARAVEKLAQTNNVAMPITSTVCDILFRGLAPKLAVENLLKREARSEKL